MLHLLLTRAAAVVIASTAVLACRPSAPLAADLAEAAGASLYDRYEPQGSPQRWFYVRGDVGVGRNEMGRLSQLELAGNAGSFIVESLGDSPVLGVGIGWQLSRQFRADLTGEYRAKAGLKALDNLTVELISPDGALQANTLYQGDVSSYVGLVNGYWDLFSLRGFTPYIGAGVGFAHNMTSGFTSSSVATFTDAGTGEQLVSLTNGTSHDTGRTNLAWALMAGTSYDLTANAKLDLGYRYLNLGTGVALSTGFLDCVCGTVGAPLKAVDLDAHEFRIGVRWMMGEPAHDTYRPLK